MLADRLYRTLYLATHLRGEARYPFRPLARVLRDQARRVRHIVAYACRYVPYYRETLPRLGLTPADFRSAGDLARLPIIEREQLRRDPEYFLSDARPPGRCVPARSSGSSGMPVTVFYDARAVVDTMLHAERSRSIALKLIGRAVGYRETSVALEAGNDAKLTRFARESTLLPRGLPGHKQSLSLTDPLESNAERIEEFKPDLLRSFGSFFEQLFPYLKARGRPFHRPKVVTYGGDALSDAVRRLIADELGIPVLSGYQAIEANRIAFECEQHRGLHINIDLHPVRIVDADGRDLPPETPGDVVVSTLVNRATVLLNYRLGDTAALLPGACPCGRSLPLMSFPLGRHHDFLELPSGRLVNGLTALHPLVRWADIWQYQLVQEAPSRFRLALVVGEGCDRADLLAHLPGEFAEGLGEPVELEVRFVAAVERDPSGKLRPVRSLVPRAQRPAPFG